MESIYFLILQINNYPNYNSISHYIHKMISSKNKYYLNILMGSGKVWMGGKDRCPSTKLGMKLRGARMTGW
jgi:hypothetical protein